MTKSPATTMLLTLLALAHGMNYINTTEIQSYLQNVSFPMESPTFFQSKSLPIHMEPMNMERYAPFYFLSGAIFFLLSAWFLIKSSQPTQQTLQIDFSNPEEVIEKYKGHVTKELVGLLENNGMTGEDLLLRMVGYRKRQRTRRFSSST